MRKLLGLQFHDRVVAMGEDQHGFFLATTFKSGRRVMARDPEEGNIIHDLLHTIVAMQRDYTGPDTLYRVAHDLPTDRDDVREEEAFVLQLQEFFTAAKAAASRA